MWFRGAQVQARARVMAIHVNSAVPTPPTERMRPSGMSGMRMWCVLVPVGGGILYLIFHKYKYNNVEEHYYNNKS